MKFEASHRHVRISPQKARYVIDLIRNKSANDALYILRCTPKRAAYFITKVLKSAIANADQRGEAVNDLYIQEARVDGGSSLKRFRPGPMGRAMSVLKRTSHIKLVLATKEPEKTDENTKK
jgi:large subunit ribosomal protein L22